MKQLSNSEIARDIYKSVLLGGAEAKIKEALDLKDAEREERLDEYKSLASANGSMLKQATEQLSLAVGALEKLVGVADAMAWGGSMWDEAKDALTSLRGKS